VIFHIIIPVHIGSGGGGGSSSNSSRRVGGRITIRVTTLNRIFLLRAHMSDMTRHIDASFTFYF
jgi:hypothetical protein